MQSGDGEVNRVPTDRSQHQRGRSRSTTTSRRADSSSGRWTTSILTSRTRRHTVWNAGDSELHALEGIQPALKLETTYGLAHDGKVNRTGLPGPLQSAVLGDEFNDQIRLAAAPGPLQGAAVAVLAPIGRLAGYRTEYP